MTAPGFTIAAAPAATLGRTDLTRRWAIANPTRACFAGVTRVEAAAAIPVIEGLGQTDVDQALIRVELGVVLSDGAGPAWSMRPARWFWSWVRTTPDRIHRSRSVRHVPITTSAW